ncbi:high-affinity nitrate transporter 3.1-like [Tripterygium wilfordii]|uniref:High-affinity nitrate transporter n=1 Tax=Tripterygium wilfordii TaxID=458696 RepID=A0A7J7DBS5_TRIWF|nr:high-affinity nitrate transporter 3.1-like [Tripterygium wilfordii]KAF5743719.1 high-affinity nitrate transporter 3.1-like [Tripterygium wilfordii]
MEARTHLLLVSLLLTCLIQSINGTVLFSSLKKTLVVTASPKPGEVLKAGEGKIRVSWGVNQTLTAGTDSAYKTIKVKLCFAPISQVDRPWRKTKEELSKDKTCQFNIVSNPYDSANKTVQTHEWTIERDLPTGTYFVRAYALDSNGDEVAYGQSTDAMKSTNLFEIQSITGRHMSLDIASIVFSAFSVVSLFGFFLNEKRKAKRSQEK